MKTDLFLWIMLFVLKALQSNVVFFHEGQNEVYSNVSNLKLNPNRPYFIYWKSITFHMITSKPQCLFSIDKIKMFVKVSFNFQPLDLYTDFNITFTILASGLSRNVDIHLQFENKLRNVHLFCSESYVLWPITANYPSCHLLWCQNIQCIAYRKKKYKAIFSTYDPVAGVEVTYLYPSNDIVSKNYIFKVNIYLESLFLGHLEKEVTIHFINSSDYVCDLVKAPIILVNSIQPFRFGCQFRTRAPFKPNSISLTVYREKQTSWDIKITRLFPFLKFSNPKMQIILHTISFMAYENLTTHTLRVDVINIYTQDKKSNCEAGKNTSYVIYIDKCVTCNVYGGNNSYFYLKISSTDNQDISSYSIVNTAICPNQKWIPDSKSTVIGVVFMRDIGNKTDEKYRKVFDVIFNVTKTVISDLKISPNSDDVNLPQEFSARCFTHGNVTIFMYIDKLVNISNSSCFITSYIPDKNIVNLTVWITIQYGSFRYLYSRSYIIGRTPTIAIITSKYPKLNKFIDCLTDGDNDNYNFQWECKDRNEPLQFVAVSYMSYITNRLIFYDTAPLTIFNCYCLVMFVNEHNRTVFYVSASVELNLNDNELANCEMRTNLSSHFIWAMIFVYAMFFFLTPAIFILIIFIITKGRFKERIQNEILTKLGFPEKELTFSSKMIPFLILSKADMGKKKFEDFLERLKDFENTISLLKNPSDPSEDINTQILEMIKCKPAPTISICPDIQAIFSSRREIVRKDLVKRYKMRQINSRKAIYMEKTSSAYVKLNNDFIVRRKVLTALEESKLQHWIKYGSESTHSKTSQKTFSKASQKDSNRRMLSVNESSSSFELSPGDGNEGQYLNFTVPLENLYPKKVFKRHSKIFYTKKRDENTYQMIPQSGVISKMKYMLENAEVRRKNSWSKPKASRKSTIESDVIERTSDINSITIPTVRRSLSKDPSEKTSEIIVKQGSITFTKKPEIKLQFHKKTFHMMDS